MGYTHYWNDKYRITEPLVDDVNAIIKQAQEDGIIIRGYDGTGDPIVTTDLISFNGDADNGLDYETAYFKNDFEESQFCKTGGVAPYDAVVCAVLLRIRHYNEKFAIGSDGDWREWKNGRELYTKVFGETPSKPSRISK
jgi:hypothetical protein